MFKRLSQLLRPKESPGPESSGPKSLTIRGGDAPTVMKDAAQVLVVVFAEDAGDHSETEDLIKTAVGRLCPPKSHLDIWFIRPGHSMLNAVRNTNCRIK